MHISYHIYMYEVYIMYTAPFAENLKRGRHQKGGVKVRASTSSRLDERDACMPRRVLDKCRSYRPSIVVYRRYIAPHVGLTPGALLG